MNKCKPIVVALTLVILLIGCSPSNVPSRFTPKPEETEFSLLITPTISSNSFSVTPQVTQSLPEKCVNLNPIETNSFTMDGKLVLRKGIEGYYLLDMNTKTILNIGQNNERIYSYILSPNRKFLFADACSGDECYYILRTVGQVINTIPSRNDWVLWRWLDNEHLLVLSLLEPHDVVILNPFTGDETKISIDPPNAHINKRTQAESLLPISLDLSLKKVLFYDEKNGGRLVLWDLAGQSEIISLPYPVEPGQTVGSKLMTDWSPDGKHFIAVSPDDRNNVSNELFRLDMDGTLVQLTDFNQEYKFANISGPVWSPDNHQIGFWLKISNIPNSNPDNLPQHLTIIDTDTLETQIYCLTYSVALHPAFPIIWGPNGQQLIANRRSANGEVEPVLVDLTHATQSVIPGTQGMWIEDWMAP